jgi:hypothetical protein
MQYFNRSRIDVALYIVISATKSDFILYASDDLVDGGKLTYLGEFLERLKWRFNLRLGYSYTCLPVDGFALLETRSN